MHDDGIGLGERELLVGQPIAVEELLLAGDELTLHAFELQPQHDDHIDTVESRGHVGVCGDPEAFDLCGQQRLRRDDAHFARAQNIERLDLRAGHAGMKNVADDGHREVLEPTFVLTDGEHVEHRLGRMGMATVTGVDDADMRRNVLRDEIRRAAELVAHHEQVRMHGLEIADGVQHRLALGGRHARGVHVDDVGREALGRDLKGGSRARAGFEEQVDDGLAAQQGDFLDLPGLEADEGLGDIEYVNQGLPRQPVDGEKVPQPAVGVELYPGRRHACYVGRPDPRSRITRRSASGPLSSTYCCRPRLRCWPTTSA